MLSEAGQIIEGSQTSVLLCSWKFREIAPENRDKNDFKDLKGAWNACLQQPW